MNLTQRCLSPLLAGNAKPFIVIDTSSASEENILTFQSLFDLGEKLCLTALPCEPEPAALRIEDFEVIESMDKVPPRKPLEVKNCPPNAPKVKVHLNGPKPRKEKKEIPDVINQLDELEKEIGSDVLGYEREIEGLRTQNMVLKCEVDKLSATSSAEGGNAYTSHLVTEVKQLRAELLNVENDRRKYETSKRLIESLIEKSNKLKAEVSSKNAKIDQLREQETVYKSELCELKKNCEYLLETNRALNLELENARALKSIRKPETSIESFYHDFLFPFNRKKEMGKAILTIHESLQRVERSVAVNAPSSVLDVRRSLSTLAKLKDCINELVSAGEKLEISAVTLIKQKTGKLN
jgi:chromosome segregation ATPase